MTESRNKFVLRCLKGLNIVLLAIPFALCWWGYYADLMEVPYFFYGNLVVIFLYIIFYYSFGVIYDAFTVSLNSVVQMTYSQCLGFLMADGVMYLVIWLLLKHFPSIWVYIVMILVQFVLSLIWCAFVHKWYFAVFPPKRAGIIYDKRAGLFDLICGSDLTHKYGIMWTKHIDDICNDITIVDSLQVIFISGVHSHERNNILKRCVDKGIDVYVIPNLGDVIMSGAHPAHLLHLPMMKVGRYDPDSTFLFLKRFFDIVCSGIAVVVLSPVILVTSIAIKFQDGGPVFYKQKRLTKDGEVFNVLKFRSMRVDAEKDGVARLSTGDKDDRITPVGRFIRKVRIDELPQLFNILEGSMSIVGPRPERPEIAEQYLKELPEFNLRLQAKAGLTGYAQVYGKYNTTPYDKLSMDLMYIAHPSFMEDLRIIFATIKILFLPESTEGVEEGQTTAL